MPIDPSIALSFKPAQFADPLEAQARRQQIQANALAMGAQQKSLEQQNALRQLYASSPDTTSPEFVNQLRRIDPEKASAYELHRAQLGQAQMATETSRYTLKSTQDKDEHEKLSRIGQTFYTLTAGDVSDENIQKAADNLIHLSGVNPTMVNEIVGRIKAVPPEGRKAAITGMVAEDEGGRKLLEFSAPKPKDIARGDRIDIVDMNPNSATYKEQLGSYSLNASPDAILSARTAATRLAYDKTQDILKNAREDKKLSQLNLSKAEMKDYHSLIATENGVDDALIKIKANPNAFGLKVGAASTLGGQLGGALLARNFTADEIKARASVTNIVSAAIKERAGTAQSKQEIKVLQGFLPNDFDDAPTVTRKLEGFKEWLQIKKNSYLPADGTEGTPAPAAAPAASAPPALSAPKVNQVVNGYRYMGGDPAKPSSWKKI